MTRAREADSEEASAAIPTARNVAKENALKVVWTLAWPVVALNGLQVVNTLIDRSFIGHLDAASLTGHGGATNVMFLAFSIAVALATGPTAIVSRAYGADQPREYRQASRQSLAVSIYVGLLVAVLVYLGAGSAARMILPANDTAAVAKMAEFVRAFAIGIPATFMIQTLAASLRGIGDTKSPMVISGGQIAIHIALNVILIPRMGLVGAGIALSISGWIATAVYLAFAVRTPIRVRPTLRPPNLEWTLRLLKIAVPASVMSALRILSLTAFTIIVALTANGSYAIAAMTTAFAIESILIAPAFGLSAAAGTLVGQSLGMENPRRAERLAWICAAMGVVSVLVFVAPIVIFTPQIAAALLGNKPEIIAEAVSLIRMMAASEALFCIAMVLFGAMQGAGDTVRPLWISIFSLWGLRVPLALFLTLPAGAALTRGIHLPFGAGMGPQGAWLAMAITQGIQGVLAIWAFKSGAWKTQKV